ncbi:tRNA (guanosine(37)-N1)-methyltransferase TrmD [Nitrospirota bacterium]
MDISVITIFPDFIRAYFNEGVIGRAHKDGLFDLDIRNPRDYAIDKHRNVDDYAYGGGPGMVMKADPIARALEDVKSDGASTLTVMVTPSGRRFDQQMAMDISHESRRLLLICGRYEGVDQRFVDLHVDEEVSVGDYVLTGGELPALVIIDAVVRLLPGVLGDSGSLEDESFSWGILDYPHYTRPPIWEGLEVPEVLLSGDHARVEAFRRKEALRRTMKFRPDLLGKAGLSEDDNKMISEIQEEESGSGQGC